MIAHLSDIRCRHRNEDPDALNQTFPAHLLITKVSSARFSARSRTQAQRRGARSGAAAGAGGRRGGRNRLDMEWVMNHGEEQRVQAVRTLIDAGEYAQAEEDALYFDDDEDDDE